MCFFSCARCRSIKLMKQRSVFAVSNWWYCNTTTKKIFNFPNRSIKGCSYQLHSHTHNPTFFHNFPLFFVSIESNECVVKENGKISGYNEYKNGSCSCSSNNTSFFMTTIAIIHTFFFACLQFSFIVAIVSAIK